jgi:hypothetical protein
MAAFPRLIQKLFGSLPVFDLIAVSGRKPVVRLARKRFG